MTARLRFAGVAAAAADSSVESIAGSALIALIRSAAVSASAGSELALVMMEHRVLRVPGVLVRFVLEHLSRPSTVNTR